MQLAPAPITAWSDSGLLGKQRTLIKRCSTWAERKERYNNSQTLILDKDEIILSLRMTPQDKTAIFNYAKSNGIQDSETLAKLNDYIDQVLHLPDAHEFNVHDFIVRLFHNTFLHWIGNYQDSHPFRDRAELPDIHGGVVRQKIGAWWSDCPECWWSQ